MQDFIILFCPSMIMLNIAITLMSHKCYSIWNHQLADCLFNSFTCSGQQRALILTEIFMSRHHHASYMITKPAQQYINSFCLLRIICNECILSCVNVIWLVINSHECTKNQWYSHNGNKTKLSTCLIGHTLFALNKIFLFFRAAPFCHHCCRSMYYYGDNVPCFLLWHNCGQTRFLDPNRAISL